MEASKEPFLPRFEQYLDCSGQMREFELYQSPQSEGVLLYALEVGQKPGYEFSAWSSAFGDAIGKLRRKIREGVSRRYLAEHPQHGLQMLTGQLAGQISQTGLVVDGRLLPWEALIEQLQASQGFNISLEITDGSN